MKKHILCLTLLLCSVLAIPPAVDAARTAPNCHELARQWFGVSLLAAVDPSSPDAAADAWFARREEDFRSVGSAFLLDAESGEAAARLSGIENFQARAELTITDADVTARTDSNRTKRNPDGTVTMYVYEWTFLDYDDLTDGAGGNDVMGYGAWHKLTLTRSGNGWTVTRDEYDETELLGLCTVTEETRANPEEAFLLSDSQREDSSSTEETDGPSPEEDAVLLDAVNYYPGYDPEVVSAYADKYALSYNPAFPNYNPVGGDCANFTSQCIYMGGMPMVTGSSGWYHELGNTSVYSARSASWTMARGLYDWMSANRGLQLVAADDTVIKGSPVFYVNRGKTAVGHAAICVGYNSAGRPIIDSHNADKYHAPWNYTYQSPAIYTVQLTGGGPVSLSIAGERAPSGNMGVGFGFGLRGVIRSDAMVTRVSADILDASGSPLAGYHYETTWNDYRYDIRTDGLNDAFIFDTLEPGSYTYVVSAEDGGGVAKTLIQSDFSVVASSITIREETLPSGTLKTGSSFSLRGIIQSALPLTKISAYVCDSTGEPVSDQFVYERNWSSETYNLRSDGVNSAFIFNHLTAGSYTYTVSATDAVGTTVTLIEAPFSVSAFTGTPEAPSVSVTGTEVAFTWQPLSGAESWRAALYDPETGETLHELTQAVRGTGQQTCTLEEIPAGTYDASVTALAGEESVQSPSVSATVESGENPDGDQEPGENPGGQGHPVLQAMTITKSSRTASEFSFSLMIDAPAYEENTILAAAAYREGRLLCCAVQGAVMGPGATNTRIKLKCPASASFDNETAVRIFLLEEKTLTVLAETVEPIFSSELDG